MLSALHNPLILDKVFDNLPPKDRKSFRLVNKTWREISLVTWRKSTAFEISRSCRTTRANGIFKFHQVFSESDEPFYKLSSVPFRTYLLKGEPLNLPPFQVGPELNDGTLAILPKMNYFFERCGPTIEFLTLGGSDFRQHRFLQGMKWLLLNLPNLVELSVSPMFIIDRQPLQDHDDVNYYQRFAPKLRSLLILADYDASLITHEASRGLLQLLPNLESLHLTLQAAHVLDALKYPVFGRHIKLRKLKATVQERHVGMLHEFVHTAKPPLSDLKLQISLKDIRRHPFTFHQLMVNLKPTLRKLSLLIEVEKNTRWIYDLGGHSLPNLTHLTLMYDILQGDEDDDPHPLRFDFRCLAGFPKLQQFHCLVKENDEMGFGLLTKDDLSYNGILDWNDQTPVLVSPMPTPLKDLKEFCFFCKERLNSDCLRFLAEWMPSIHRLAFVADEDTFPIVMDLWSLDKLTLLPVNWVEPWMVKWELAERPKQCITIEEIHEDEVSEVFKRFGY